MLIGQECHGLMSGQRYVDFRICELYNVLLHLRLIVWAQFLATLGSESGSQFVILAKQN